MTSGRIGLIGGMSWESTASYYAYANRLSRKEPSSWTQPRMVIDSIDFHDLATWSSEGNWDAVADLLVDSARRLEAAGASVIALAVNTPHIVADRVVVALSVPFVDIRDALIESLSTLGASSVAVLGTRYTMEEPFYATYLEERDIRVVIPTASEIDELHAMIYDELTLGIVRDATRERFAAIAVNCRNRGAEVVGLCCSEFGLVMEEDGATRVVDSMRAHVRALLRAIDAA